MFLSAISELIFPRRCLGCQQLGASMCSMCRSQWNPHVYRLTFSGKHTVYSAIPYSSVAQRVILTAKEDGNLQAQDLIISTLVHVAQYFMSEVGSGVLVPIPSRKSAVRKRGRDFISDIAMDVAEHIDLDVEDLLLHNRHIRDQSRLNQRQRFENVDGAISLDNKLLIKVYRKPVILIDDLVTTGATLHSATRALQREGVRVLGSITAAFAKAIR